MSSSPYEISPLLSFFGNRLLNISSPCYLSIIYIHPQLIRRMLALLIIMPMVMIQSVLAQQPAKQLTPLSSGRILPPQSLRIDPTLQKTIPRPQTVVDYFLLLPEGYFTQYGSTTSSVKQFPTATRKTILTCFTSDTATMRGVELFTGALEIKNKYLIVNTPEGSQGYSFSVALWTLKNKKTLVGFCRRRWERNGAASEVAFLTYENSRWTDVTTKVFPEIPMTTFFTWSGLKQYPNLKAPIDMELARAEQAIIVHLDMLTLQQMPELKPIGTRGLEKTIPFRTLEMRLRDDAFTITNKY